MTQPNWSDLTAETVRHLQTLIRFNATRPATKRRPTIWLGCLRPKVLSQFFGVRPGAGQRHRAVKGRASNRLYCFTVTPM
jgi:hypothetical protein